MGQDQGFQTVDGGVISRATAFLPVQVFSFDFTVAFLI
jgi:hypothetical protein